MKDVGVLVGWGAQDWGSRLVLDIETVADAKDKASPTVYHLFMTKNQAAVLANYLFEASGRLPPTGRRPGLIRRLLG
jgi:hypothetical protein